MPELGLRILDKSVHDTNAWLQEISDAMDYPDKQVAYHALRGTLFALRDRIPPDEAAHLGAELPLLVRGIYYEGFNPSRPPQTYDRDGFLQRVSQELEAIGGEDPEAAARAVFGVLHRHIDEGQEQHVREALPESIRTLWPNRAG